MPKRKNPDLPNQTSRDGTQIGFRLTPNEETALDRLVANEHKTLEAKGIPKSMHAQLTSRSMVLRALIERESKRLGLWPEQDGQDTTPIQAAPVAPAVEVQPIPTQQAAPAPVEPISEAKQREMLAKAGVKNEAIEAAMQVQSKAKKSKPLDEAGLKARLKQASTDAMKAIASDLGVGSSAVYGWRGKAAIPPARFDGLDAALKKHGA